MKKLTVLIACLALSAVSLCACSNGVQPLNKDLKRNTDSKVTYNYNDSVQEPPAIYSAYASNVTNLELKILRNYAKENPIDNSFVISPVNTALQIGLLANGGSESTTYELTNTIGTDLNLTNINICSSYFKSRLEAVSLLASSKTDSLSGKKEDNSDKFIDLENNIIFNDTSDVKSSFLQSATDYYTANIFRMPFEKENALSDVNSIFADYTSKDAFSKLDSKHNMITVSSSKLNDSWITNYPKDKITKGTFVGKNGNRDVTYLESVENVLTSNTAKAVIKYTEATPLKVMLIKPNDGITVDEYISDFTNLEYSNLLESFNITKTETVRIPEFSITSSGKAESMKSVLESCGLKTAFTDDSKFSNLSHDSSIYVNDIFEIQPSFSFTANGIATNKNTMSATTAKTSDNKDVFEINSSFVFVVLDNESSIPLYMGAVV